MFLATTVALPLSDHLITLHICIGGCQSVFLWIFGTMDMEYDARDYSPYLVKYTRLDLSVLLLMHKHSQINLKLIEDPSASTD
jgi:hypothetical protein